jgi:pantoate--beta-alanine ligase
MPKTVRKTEILRRELDKARALGKRIGFVPTMGYLHDGHLALVDECRRQSDLAVVSIFVNPKQFGPNEDLDRYPRNLRRDRGLLAKHGCDMIFLPAEHEIYPPGFATRVSVEGLSDRLCGLGRPGHFDGVSTVVLRLLLAVAPDVAFFGEKDYQQLVIVRKLVEDLGLSVGIDAVPTVRDKDGLALSSRNAYLSESERAAATSIYKSLEMARLLVAGGEQRARKIEERLTDILVEGGISKVEYVAVVDPGTLDPVKYIDSEARVVMAAWVGNTRLIDNLAVTPPRKSRRRAAPRRGTVGVVLAAGEGKRMKSDSPKMLQPIDGKPMVQHVMDAAREAGIKDLIAVVGHRSDKVGPVMKKLRVETVLQEVQRGTGHAVLQAYPRLSRFGGTVVVLSGDTPLIRSQSIKQLLALHARHSNAVTFATTVVPDATGYGRIVRDKAGVFSKIVEEKDADTGTRAIKEINAGLYCFKAQLLFDSLLSVKADNVQMEYYLTDALETIKGHGGRVEAVIIEDHTEMLGVNTAVELNAVKKLYRRRKQDGDNKRRLEDGIHRKRER